jgi:hypothetical protein
MNQVNQSWLYGTVKPYFETQGIKLLRDDMAFIEKCLSRIPQERHRLIMRNYLAVWNTSVAEKENASSERVNARFEANTYLRNESGVR